MVDSGVRRHDNNSRLSPEMKRILCSLLDLSRPIHSNKTARSYATFSKWPFLPLIAWVPQHFTDRETNPKATASLSRTLRKLEKRGLLRRFGGDYEPLQASSRTMYVALTPTGRDLALNLIINEDDLKNEREEAREQLWEETPKKLREIGELLTDISNDEAYGITARTVQVALTIIAKTFEELDPHVNQLGTKSSREIPKVVNKK